MGSIRIINYRSGGISGIELRKGCCANGFFFHLAGILSNPLAAGEQGSGTHSQRYVLSVGGFIPGGKTSGVFAPAISLFHDD